MMCVVQDGVKADDVGANAVMTVDPAESGDCGNMLAVVGEGDFSEKKGERMRMRSGCIPRTDGERSTESTTKGTMRTQSNNNTNAK